ncbi:MAG: heavy metal translocating P-type ATPase [Eubacteriales bacterium]
MSGAQKKTLVRILLTGGLLAVAMVGNFSWELQLALCLGAWLLIGFDVLWKAVGGVLRGQMLDENFLMALATVGAFFIGEYSEGVAVMLFYQIGELFQSYAVGKSRRSIAALMEICPDSARVLRNGEEQQVDPEEVQVEELIRVRPGERIPLDGVVVEGAALADTAALTGESMPRRLEMGMEALSGSIALDGALTIRVTRPFEQSTVSRILELVENSAEKKAKAENFITRFARWYTPLVVAAAILVALVPPLLLKQPFTDWLRQALVFLVVSCPCALVISVPLSYFGGIGGASRQGILIKGGNYLETLARCDRVVLDKTGTLTRGQFQVSRVLPKGVTEKELLWLAASGESFSNHPIARSLRQAVSEEIAQPTQVEELAGRGVRAVVNGQTLLIGGPKLLEEHSIACPGEEGGGTQVYVARDGQYIGCIQLEDLPKPEAGKAIEALRQEGIRQVVMLTGDREEAAGRTAGQLGIDRWFAQLLPQDKVQRVEELLEEPGRGTLAFVGDGINDAPVLSRADVGIAMGALGSDAAIEAADVVLMTDDLSKIPKAISIARRTQRIVRQNIVFALGVKLLVMLLGLLQVANLWEAVFADVGVSVLAILNAMRTLRTPKE